MPNKGDLNGNSPWLAAFATELAHATADVSGFRFAVLRLLTGHLELRAAQFYVAKANGDAFVLREEFPDGRKNQNGSVLVDLASASNPDDLVTSVPLTAALRDSSAPVVPTTQGMLRLHATTAHALSRAIEVGTVVAPLVAHLYFAAVQSEAARLRQRLMRESAFRSDIASLTHSYLKVITDSLAAEVGTVWVFDARRNRLYRRQTYGVRAERGLSLHPDDDSLVAQCFRRGVAFRYDGGLPDPMAIAPDDGLNNWKVLPLLLPPMARLQGRASAAAGVVEIANQYRDEPSGRDYGSETWEADYLSWVSADTLAVLLFQSLRIQDHESTYERVMHGAKTSLQAARANLQGLASALTDDATPPRARHFLPDALAWISELSDHLSKGELLRGESLAVSEVQLDVVLRRLPALVESLNVRTHLKPLALTWAGSLEWQSTANVVVSANVEALMVVLRELIDNAVRYCRPLDSDARSLTIAVMPPTSSTGSVVLLISDNGAPVPKEEAEHIFQPGYRGRAAQARQPHGTGQGLADCAQLMARMGGRITLLETAAGVTFELALQQSRLRAEST